LVVAVPAAEGGGTGVGEKKCQRRRFDVAVAKDHGGDAESGLNGARHLCRFTVHKVLDKRTPSTF